MIAVVTSDKKVCLKRLNDEIYGNIDFVIFMIGLFGAIVFTISDELTLSLYSNDEWKKAAMGGAISRFYFPILTKKEIIIHIKKIYPDIKIRED